MNKSFLKWAGGKSKSIDFIASAMPYKIKRLVEPFVGSAVVSLNIEADEYLLADYNKDLIYVYETLKKEQQHFIEYCADMFSLPNDEEIFYNNRDRFNSLDMSVERAALFIYLNRYSFNGLCRYNSSGKFNVPFGKYKTIYFPREEMEFFVEKSDRFNFMCCDFEETFAQQRKGDVIYCVPENTLIYQNGSYLPIKDVEVEKTNLGNGNVCLKKHKRYAEKEELIRLDIMGVSRHFDLLFSKDHILFTYDTESESVVEKRAKDLLETDRLLIEYEKEINDYIPKYEVYSKRNSKFLTIDYTLFPKLGKFLGLYIAEGHMQDGPILSFSIAEHHLHILTKALIEEVFGIEAHICPESPHSTVTQVKSFSKELESYILEFYNGKTARRKKLKDFVMFWPHSVQLELLKGWLLGDGGIWQCEELSKDRKFIRTNSRNKYKITGTSISIELAIQMYNIALRCGLHPCFKRRSSKAKDGLTKDGRADIVTYDVYFTMKKDVELLLGINIEGRNCGRRFHKGGHLVTRINKITKELYTGNMYDLTTTKGNFWCFGNVKVHNCDPPYIPLNTTSSFTSYTDKGFPFESQQKLVKLAESSNNLVLISNHWVPGITEDLYKNGDTSKRKHINRSISAKGDSRRKVEEVLIIYNN